MLETVNLKNENQGDSFPIYEIDDPSQMKELEGLPSFFVKVKFSKENATAIARAIAKNRTDEIAVQELITNGLRHSPKAGEGLSEDENEFQLLVTEEDGEKSLSFRFPGLGPSSEKLEQKNIKISEMGANIKKLDIEKTEGEPDDQGDPEEVLKQFDSDPDARIGGFGYPIIVGLSKESGLVTYLKTDSSKNTHTISFVSSDNPFLVAKLNERMDSLNDQRENEKPEKKAA